MNTKRRLLPWAAAAAALPLLLTTGCAALSDDASTSTDGGPVVAAFYPLHFVTQRVAGDVYDVINLTRPGYEAHDLDLSIRETAEVTDASLVIHLGGFQPAVDDAVANNANGTVLDIADAVDLLPADGHDHDDHDHGDHEEGDHEGDDEDHAHEEGEEHADADHDHGDHDPHFWLDPLRMADAADAVAEQLAEVRPEHADEFSANAAELRTELVALDQAYAEGLADCRIDTVVVAHNAFAYLAGYGLEFEAVAGLSPGAEPTAAVLDNLHQVIEEHGITTVFSETLGDQSLIRSLADDLGIETAVLDPIEGLTEETATEDYLSLMERNLTALQKANRC